MRIQKMKLLLIALAAIWVTWLAQPTLAYYTVTGTATNVVTSGDIELMIHEKTADGQDFPAEGIFVIPGDTVSKVVTVENVSTHPFYLRGRRVSSVTDDLLSAEDCLALDLNTQDWTLHSDGFLYYNSILTPGEVTAPVLTAVEIVGQYVTQNHVGTTLSLTVEAYAVQSEHNPAEHPWEAAGWPAA